MPTYNQLPVEFAYGKGVWLWDTTGKKYLDGLSGIAVCALGHAHPAITAAITEQAGKLLHISNVFRIPQQQQLAAELVRLSGMEQAFFCNSGAEANEAAIKLTRLFGRQKDIATPEIVVMESSFHGRTLATLSASGSRKVRAGYEPFVQGYLRAPFNDLNAIHTIAKSHHDVVAIMLEPIQGEGGIIVPHQGYLEGIREICNKHDWLMILDEVQTGLGRTGKMFAYQHSDILPDIVSLAKALGNGIPIGACLARGKACGLFEPGKHGSTFGGNPFACHVAYTVLRVLQEEGLVAHADRMGQYLLHSLRESLSTKNIVKDVRGKGLMLGVELDRPCRDLLSIGLEKGLLFNVTRESIVRLLPPLIINQDEADQLVDRLTQCVTAFAKKGFSYVS